MKTLVAIALLGLLALGFFWERSAADKLRAENESLGVESEEANRLAEENRELPRLRPAASSQTNRSSTTELLRLRNQVSQLRAQQKEAEKLRAANQRVAEEIKSGKFAPRRLADMEGAVPREKWAFAGFGTPEATVQSFFAAASSGQPEQLFNCMTPRSIERMKRLMDQNPEQFKNEFVKAMEMFGKVSGFRVLEIRPKDGVGDRIEAMVQVAADGEGMPLPLRRVGNEWKLDD